MSVVPRDPDWREAAGRVLVVDRANILTATDEELRLIAREIVATLQGMMTKTQNPTEAASQEAASQPIGYAPMIKYVRVRNPSGIMSTDAAGEPRINAQGQVINSQRGELLCCEGWRHAELLISQKIVLPITEEDYLDAPACAHGAKFAPDAFPGEHCHCEDVLRDTDQPWTVPDAK